MNYEYLRPSPPMPAIREAMMKAVQLSEKGVQVFDFSSGSVGNLLYELPIFHQITIDVKMTYHPH